MFDILNIICTKDMKSIEAPNCISLSRQSNSTLNSKKAVVPNTSDIILN